MRKHILSLMFGAAVLSSCTKNFKEANTDPTTAPDVPSRALLTKGLLDVSGYDYATWRANFIYTTLFVQQFASTGWPQGDKYFFSEDYNSAQWADYYPNTIKGLVNLVLKTSGNAEEVNYNAAARVLRVYAFTRLTDLYGDIPYSEAAKGYTDNLFQPKYDEQSSIYADMLNELEEAAVAFDPAKPFAGDITSYAGNTGLWKKAAYSLMLRLAMRLSKADANAADEWVGKAQAGGLISSTEESFRILHLASPHDNPNSHILGNYTNARLELDNNNFKFSETFVETLDATSDPRRALWFVVGNGTAEDPNPALQQGLPNGTDPNNLPANTLPTYSKLRRTFTDATDPNILISFAQTQLLLAEAAERGWATGTGADYFRTGVLAAVNQLKMFDPGGTLTFNDAANQTWANNLAYGATLEERLESINTQYWIASLLDGHESFANWRRSGYPELTPVNFTGNYTNGVIPRRLQYPSGEAGSNKTNYDAAVARQGANNFTTRVWWDKP